MAWRRGAPAAEARGPPSLRLSSSPEPVPRAITITALQPPRTDFASRSALRTSWRPVTYARRRLLPLLFSCFSVAFPLPFRCFSGAPEVRRSVALRERQIANRERNCASGDVQGGAGRKVGARTMREMLWPTKKHRDGSRRWRRRKLPPVVGAFGARHGCTAPPPAAFARVAQPSRPLELTQLARKPRRRRRRRRRRRVPPSKAKGFASEASLELP